LQPILDAYIIKVRRLFANTDFGKVLIRHDFYQFLNSNYDASEKVLWEGISPLFKIEYRIILHHHPSFQKGYQNLAYRIIGAENNM